MENKQIFKCSVCGNVVEVLHASYGQLVCCGKPMNLLEEKSGEEGTEKHKPVIEKSGEEVVVKVGSIEHPMEEKHYIEWIELIFGNKVFRKFLHPGEKPEARFKVKGELDGLEARAYCNLHGLWKNE